MVSRFYQEILYVCFLAESVQKCVAHLNSSLDNQCDCRGVPHLSEHFLLASFPGQPLLVFGNIEGIWHENFSDCNFEASLAIEAFDGFSI